MRECVGASLCSYVKAGIRSCVHACVRVFVRHFSCACVRVFASTCVFSDERALVCVHA